MPVESVESQPQDSPYFHEPLGNPYRGFPIPTAPTTNSFHILLSVDGCRSLRRNIIAPASLLSDVIGFTSDSLIDFAGIPSGPVVLTFPAFAEQYGQGLSWNRRGLSTDSELAEREKR